MDEKKMLFLAVMSLALSPSDTFFFLEDLVSFQYSSNMLPVVINISEVCRSKMKLDYCILFARTSNLGARS